ncbi:hypothetical protein QFZ65_002710 [Arthrobacter sp. B3I9]|uniref:DUF4192 family protein n=1 Tax=Arthrobacter sp. B3I9 TaxID=3042270 RepID=UPI0027906FE3|nr:DUF4192 family protein [Arthrobacter sp. B3I9]MDQ0850772.1 hypothetical protein [Arthrobacter sp. B3I9]
MTAPEHLKITRPEDVLGFIPHSLGYWPSESLVAMTMQGKRLGATLRVDLPGGRSPGGFARFARTVAGYLEADDKADGVLLAFFLDSDVAGAGGDLTGHDLTGAGADWAGLLEELEDALGASGMPVRDAWLIGHEYWRNAYCTDPSCCTPPGRPIDDIKNSRLSTEMVFRGSTVGPAPGADAPCPGVLPVDPELLEAERQWFGLLSGHARNRLQFSQVLDVWTVVLRSPPAPRLPVELAGYLRATLRVPAWRDAVLVMAAAGPGAAQQGAAEFGMFDRSVPGFGPAGASAPAQPGSRARQGGASGTLRTMPPFTEVQPGSGLRPQTPPPPVPPPPLDGFPSLLPGDGRADVGGPGQPGGRTGAGATGEGTASEGPGQPGGRTGAGAPAVPGYGEVLLGLAPSTPDWALLASLDRILVQLGESGGEAGAAALTGRGWIEWCRGKGSFADALFNRAQVEHPGYRLAALLAELVNRGTVCGWAARRESAWQRFEPGAA